MSDEPNVSYVSFSINGDFITKSARDICYYEKDPARAVRLLMDATDCDDISYEEHLGIVIQILDGKAMITGTTGKDYRLEETPDNESLGFFDKMSEMAKEIESLKKQLYDEQRKRLFILEEMDLSSWRLKQLQSDYAAINDGEALFEDIAVPKVYRNEPDISPVGGKLLNDYMKNLQQQKTHDYDPAKDYGWLEPGGRYHPVEWGDHGGWAERYLKQEYRDHDPTDENSVYYKRNPDGTKTFYAGSDCLVYCLHWVLVDSPHQGTPRATYDESYGLTKRQKEFLYKHFMERGMTTEANALYKDQDI